MKNISTVVFFTYNFPSRNDKRITQFIEKGYKVIVYSFVEKSQPQNYSIIRLGNYPRRMSYFKRLYHYSIDIKREARKFDKQTTLFFFSLLSTPLLLFFLLMVLNTFMRSLTCYLTGLRQV